MECLEVEVRAGSPLDLAIEDGDLVVRVRRPAAFDLEDLLAGVAPGKR